MSLPARAASSVNWDPVSCMPSPESPANRMTTESRTSRALTPRRSGEEEVNRSLMGANLFLT